MSESFDKVELVLAADNNYAQHLGVALASIVDNYKDDRSLVFHVLDNGINAKNKEYLKDIVSKKGMAITFYNIPEELLRECPEVNHLTKASYARLLISELLPSNISRVLYLDADIVVLGNIAELYDKDLEGCTLGAVADVMAEEILRIYFCPGLSKYFNAGVLLIDLDSWRRQNVKNRSLEFIDNYFYEIIRADQDILNCLFKDDWKLLDSRFNTDLKRSGPKSMPGSDTVVLHYSDRIKPWHYLFSGVSGQYYFAYLEKTPWNYFKFGDKNFKNFFKKRSLLLIKEFKRTLLPHLPASLLDKYRRLLWRTYKMKK